MHPLTPLAIRIGRLSRLPQYLPLIVAVDKALHRLSGGRFGLLTIAGLPQLFLTVRGRRSGIPRTTPLLGVPHEGGFIVAGSNGGAPKPPAWVFNLRAHPPLTPPTPHVTRGYGHRTRGTGLVKCPRAV